MSAEKIFCCNRGLACSNYKRSTGIQFEYIRFDEGYSWSDWNISGICWVFLLSGKVVVSVKNSKVVAEAGEMFLLPPWKGSLKAFTSVEFIYFVSDRFAEYGKEIVSKESSPVGMDHLPEKLPFTSSLEGFLELLSGYLKDGLNCTYLFEEKQEELLVLMKAGYSKEQLGTFFYVLSLQGGNDLKKSIENHCLHVKSVKELAQACGYSVPGFKRIFKEIFNTPIYQWILQKKADVLKERLSGEDISIKEIIYEFGFSSPAHFTKFCKQWLGMTPTQFIEKQRTMRRHGNG